MEDSIKSNVSVDSVKISDTELFYAKFGRGKKTLVILPGLYPKSLMPLAPMVAQMYTKFLDSYTIYMLDRVTNPADGYSIQDMARDTIKAMDELKIKDAYMMGNSMGGMLAQAIAIERGDLVKKLVLSSTAPSISEKSRKLFEEWEKAGLSKKHPDFAELLGSSIYSPSYYEKFKENIIASFGGMTDADYRRFVIFVRAMLKFDIRSELPKIKASVLAFGAGQDKVFSAEQSEEIASKTGGKAFIYQEYGHAACDEAPDFLEKLWNFFENDKTN